MGYYLGRVIPDVDKYLLPIVLGIIVTSFVPSIIHISQENKSQEKDWALLSAMWKFQGMVSHDSNL